MSPCWPLGFSPRRVDVFNIFFRLFSSGFKGGTFLPETGLEGAPETGGGESAIIGWGNMFSNRVIFIAREEEVNTTEGSPQFGQTSCLRTRRQME